MHGSTGFARRAREREAAMRRGSMRYVFVTMAAVVMGIVWGVNDPGGGGSERGGDHAHAAGGRAELDARRDGVPVDRVDTALARELALLHTAVNGFADVDAAMAAGYEPATGCMEGPLGAQGIHYAKGALFGLGVSNHAPHLLMYEPHADGSLRFVGVEYLVFQAAWHDEGHVEPPSLFGQTFGLNDTLLDEPFYLLHVWIGQFNPSGLFADWNPLVSCGRAAPVSPIVIDVDMP